MAAGARTGLPQAASAACLLALSLALFWPGIALYDSVDQYRQILSGAYEDWHPPVMARLWSLFQPWWPGTAPMLVVQLGLYWLGIGLIAAACARRGRPGAGWAILAAGALLFASCWMGAILKDAQMVGAMAAALGIIGWFRIAERPLPLWAGAAALLLLVYAVLVRANAVFAIAPLVFGLFGWAGISGRWKRAAATLALAILLILVSPIVNHDLLGAESSGVEKSLLVYDIGGIGARTGAAPAAGLPGTGWATLKRDHCYSPVEWDALGEDPCAGAALMKLPTSQVAHLWLAAALGHPLAYAEHRLAHFDTTMRLVVPAGLAHAISPVDPQPNRLGLGDRPGPALAWFHAVALECAALPTSWPAFWLALDLVAFWAAARAAPGPFRDLAFALALSALTMGASFLVVSIASDFRYHLWTMLAAMLAFILLAAAGALRRRHWLAAAGLLAGVTLAGSAARLLLPAF
jgi:hypothetical protein